MNHLLKILSANLKDWPEGMAFAVNSKLDDEVFFHEDGDDWWREAPKLSEYVAGAKDKDAYHVVTQSDWESAR